MSQTLILSDESLNAYGFRVLTNGIRLDRFVENPVMLYGHYREEKGTGRPILPIGKWTNVRRAENKLLGDPVFDMSDDFSTTIARKFQQGTLNAASINIDPLEWSEEDNMRLPGQTLPTITKCDLIEISLCDIPVNRNAVRLSDPSLSSFKLSLNAGETAYEALWRANRLEAVKASNPIRFKLLEAEFLGDLRVKKLSAQPSADTHHSKDKVSQSFGSTEEFIKSRSFLEIMAGAEEYNRLWTSERLAILKTNDEKKFNFLVACFKANYMITQRR